MEKDTVKITCVNCGKIFIYKIGTYKSRRATYCSTECRTLWQRNPIIPCKTCGKMFYPTNQRRYYCSRACVDYKHNRKIADPVERFWKLVDRTSTPDGCWPWNGFRDRDNYGNFSISENGKWINIRAHKFAIEMVVGKLPEGIQTLHHCDNPPCCRPDHLWFGKNRDNMDDKIKKGRQARGEKCNNTNLTEEVVREIRKRLAMGETGTRIAADYGVSNTVISQIKHRQTWKHVI